MQLERQKYLNVRPHKRTPPAERSCQRLQSKTVITRMGTLTFAVPQVLEGGFYPSSLEKGIRSERALKPALTEMYVQGAQPDGSPK